MDQATSDRPANTFGYLYPGSTIRYDPDGASIGPDIPDALLLRWQRMLADCGKAQAHMHRNYERFFKSQEAYQRDLRDIISKASALAETIDTLADAIGRTQDMNEAGALLAEASPFILDCLDAIGTHLAGLDDEAMAAAKRNDL